MTRFRTRVLIVTILGLGAFLAATQLGYSEDPKPAAPRAYKPVQPIHEMMEGQKKLFSEIKDGLLDKQWNKASQSAWILAEVANANSYQNDAADYRDWAVKMSQDCVTLAQNLKKKDEAGAKEMVTKVGQTCQACHDKYQK